VKLLYREALFVCFAGMPFLQHLLCCADSIITLRWKSGTKRANYANNKDACKKQRNSAATEKINQQSTHSGPKFSAAVMPHNNTFNLLSDLAIINIT
jgi:hypothetical protein